MKKLLVICGPTSIGKSSLALSLAKKFAGEIVSADSRQVYKGLNIGTGKDLPGSAKIKYPWFAKYGYYEIGGIKVWGYDLADPRHEYSVSQYLKFADRIIEDISRRGRLPVLVGGTGLYLKAVIDGIPTAFIPKNDKLRRNLESKKPEELYELLAQMDAIKAGQMNSSDKMNPRRLIRAIEIATWKVGNVGRDKKVERHKSDIDFLMIGLTAPKDVLDERIRSRVSDRVKMGIIEEIKNLIRKGLKWDSQAMASMGYGDWQLFFEGKKTREEVVKDWTFEEVKYAKRQLTWFKKEKRINWFDITGFGYPENVENLIKKWHNGAYVPQG